MTTTIYGFQRTGDWTPAIQDDSLSDGESQTYNVQVGTWSKIGKKVDVQGRVKLTSLGTLNTAQGAKLANLPFTTSATTNNYNGMSIGFGNGLAITVNTSVSGWGNLNSTYINLYVWDATTGTSVLPLSKFTATGDIVFSFTYFTD